MAIKGLSLFANVGIGELYLKKVGVDIVVANELLEKRADFYKHVHSDSTMITGDITDKKVFKQVIEEAKKQKVEFLVATPPCFVEGVLVQTLRGLIPIEQVSLTDQVLTHKNQYKPVLELMRRPVQEKIRKLKIRGSEEILTTQEHPFYIKQVSQKWNNQKRRYEKVVSNPMWLAAKDLNKNSYVGIAINQSSKLIDWDGVVNDSNQEIINNLPLNNENFYWFMGRYLADGWLRIKGEDSKVKRNDIIICSGKNKEDSQELENNLSKLFNFNKQEDRTTFKYIVSSKELSLFLKNFLGQGAKNKFISKEILDLPVNFLKSFLEGYLSGDGSYKNGKYKLTTINKNLAYMVSACIHKVYKTPTTLCFNKIPSKKIIEGREVNQQSFYTVEFFVENSPKYFLKDDKYLWVPVRKNEEIDYQGNVYNLEVHEDNSYTVNNLIVHNCQGFSLAGKQEADDPRNTLILKVIESIELLSPKYVIIENVPQMLKAYINYRGKSVKIMDLIQKRLGKNYTISSQVLDAADYGTPQHRKRAFVLLVKGKETWPLPAKQKHITVREAIGHLPSLESGESSDIPLHVSKVHNPNHVLWMKHTPSGQTAHDNKVYYPQKDNRPIKGFRSTYQRLHWDRPATTITMNNGDVGSQSNVHPGRDNGDGTYSDARVFTLHELLILSGIPLDWKIPPWANERLIRQVIGEMVAPKMIETLVKELKLKSKDKK